MKTLVVALSTLTAALFASACGSLAPSECTLIGCLGTLEVRVVDDAGAPVSAFNGVVTNTSGREITFACPADADNFEYRCGTGSVSLNLLGEDAPPDAVDVFLAAGTDSPTKYEVKPAWTGFEPNGPGCGVCHSGVVTVALK